jgi:hypothetical protein
MSGGASSSKPEFLNKQGSLDVFNEMLRRFQSGAPTAVEGLQAQRTNEQLGAQSAQAGLDTADPLTQRKLALGASEARKTGALTELDVFKQLIAPSGQSSSSFQAGLK